MLASFLYTLVARNTTRNLCISASALSLCEVVTFGSYRAIPTFKISSREKIIKYNCALFGCIGPPGELLNHWMPQNSFPLRLLPGRHFPLWESFAVANWCKASKPVAHSTRFGDHQTTYTLQRIQRIYTSYNFASAAWYHWLVCNHFVCETNTDSRSFHPLATYWRLRIIGCRLVFWIYVRNKISQSRSAFKISHVIIGWSATILSRVT